MGRPNGDPILTRASVTFHTNDEDKDFDTRVDVVVNLTGVGTIASISDPFGRFGENSDAGPFTLLMESPVGLNEIRPATVNRTIHPVTGVVLGTGDTWRFNFLLDFFFSDGSHLLSRASNLELSGFSHQTFGLE